MRTDPIYAGFVGDVQDGEAIQLQVMQIPRCSNLVREWDRESIEGKPIRLERLCNWGDNLYHTL